MALTKLVTFPAFFPPVEVLLGMATSYSAVARAPAVLLLCLLCGAHATDAQLARRLQLDAAQADAAPSSDVSHWDAHSVGTIPARTTRTTQDKIPLGSLGGSDAAAFNPSDHRAQLTEPSAADGIITVASAVHNLHAAAETPAQTSDETATSVDAQQDDGMLIAQADGDDFGNSFEDGRDDFPHPSDYDVVDRAQNEQLLLAQAEGDDFGNGFEDGRDDFPHPSDADSDQEAFRSPPTRRDQVLVGAAGFGGGFLVTALGAFFVLRRRRTDPGRVTVRRAVIGPAAPASGSQGLVSV